RLERRPCGGGIGDVAVDGAGVTAAPDDVPHQRLGRRHAAMRVNVHVVAVTRQAAAQRATDAAAAARHQGASGSGAHARVPALNTMLARPLTSGCCALDTENSYSTVRASPVTRSAAAMRSACRSSRRATCRDRKSTRL